MNQGSFVPGRKLTLGAWLLVVLALAVSFAALPVAPDRVPTHWGLSGEPDRFSARFPGLFVMPMIMVLIAFLLPLLPRIDPRKQNYAAFGSTYGAIQVGILGFLLALHVVTIAAALGMPINMNMVVMPLVGLLFVGLGNVMGKIRPNWFVGFRTPWALYSSDVWTRTHRFGGRVMVALGLTMIVGGLLLPAIITVSLIAVGSCVLVVLTFAYSYVVWRQFGEPRG